jgi:hypothetical protein
VDERETQLQIGKLMLEQLGLEKQIAALRDELFQPERLVFEGQTVDEQFAGEAAIDRNAMAVDSVIAELRAAILRKKASTVDLAEMGIDLEAAEREDNLRKSRALLHPANLRYGPEDIGAARDRRPDVGFTRPGRKSRP